jgi:putative ATP-binding cassette transporter
MRSAVGSRVKLLFAALLTLLLAINALNVVNSYVGRDFMTAIEQRSMSGFLTMAALYVGVFAVSTITAVIYRFTEERLGLLWRHWMTRELVERYLQGATYYRLREHAEIPNPDQRIADDVRTFTATTLSLPLIWLNGTFTIVAFSGVIGRPARCSSPSRWPTPASARSSRWSSGGRCSGSTTTRATARRASARSWCT